MQAPTSSTLDKSGAHPRSILPPTRTATSTRTAATESSRSTPRADRYLHLQLQHPTALMAAAAVVQSAPLSSRPRARPLPLLITNSISLPCRNLPPGDLPLFPRQVPVVRAVPATVAVVPRRRHDPPQPTPTPQTLPVLLQRSASRCRLKRSSLRRGTRSTTRQTQRRPK